MNAPTIANEAAQRLLDKLPPLPKKQAPNRASNGASGMVNKAWGQAALTYELNELEATGIGDRNNQLFKTAAALFEIVAGGSLDGWDVDNALTVAGREIGLDPAEIRGAIRRGRERGERNPRYAPLNISTRYERGIEEESPIGNANLGTIVPILPAVAARDSDVDGMLRSSPLTDAGSAECLALLYGDTFRYDHTRNTWMVWADGLWGVDDKGAADRAALEVVRARQQACMALQDVDRKKHSLSFLIGSENAAKRKGMLQTAAILPEFTTVVSEYDRNDWLAATPQGTLDLRTGELHEARRDDLITMRLGAPYDPTAKAPRWARFLDEIFCGDEDLIAFIQRAIGYSLTGDTREQCFFIGYGTGANGKSVLLEIVGQMLGDYAGNAPFSTFDADRRSEASNDLASLRGRRFVSVVETDEGGRLAEARVKAVTGQDTVTCRYLYGQFFSYKPTYKIWLGVNHKPVIRGTDLGIWRRIRLIPFSQTFSGKEDRQLAATLRRELPGILNWALAGLRDWLANGLGTAKAVEAATAEYRTESDLVGLWFDDCCAGSSTSTVLASDAYESFRAWCKTFGYREPTQMSFGLRLDEKGFAKLKLRGKRQYQGFIIRDPLPTEA
jgi:putative DNA primase/helicase